MKRIIVAPFAFPLLRCRSVRLCRRAARLTASTCTTLGGAGMGACFFPATVAAARTPCGDVTEYCDTSPRARRTSTASARRAPAPDGSRAGEGDADRLRARLLERARLEQRQGAGVRRRAGDRRADPATQQALGAVTGDARPGHAARLRRRRRQGLLDPDGHRLHAADVQRRPRRPQRRSASTAATTAAAAHLQRPAALGGALRDRRRADQHAAGHPRRPARAARATRRGRRRWRSTSSCRRRTAPARSLSDTDCLDTSTAANPKYQLNVSALSARRLREHPGHLRAVGRHQLGAGRDRRRGARLRQHPRRPTWRWRRRRRPIASPTSTAIRS